LNENQVNTEQPTRDVEMQELTNAANIHVDQNSNDTIREKATKNLLECDQEFQKKKKLKKNH
jgi:hypothetical protein